MNLLDFTSTQISVKNTVYLESMTSFLLHIIVLQDLEYRDGLLVAGSLDALIELLMPTESHYPEKTYSYAFILCSRLFIRPYELLARVSRVRRSPPPPLSLSLSLSLSLFYISLFMQTFHMRLKQLTTSGQSPIEDYAPYVIELIR